MIRDQLGLVFKEAERPRLSLEERYQDFIRENPHVLDLFARFTFELIKAGHRRGSGDAIGHRIRWHCSVEIKGDEFKLNNNWIAFLVRDFQRLYPKHAEFFATREQKGRAA